MIIVEINGKKYLKPFSFQEIYKPVRNIDPDYIFKRGEVVNGVSENDSLVSLKKGDGITKYSLLKELFVKGGDYIENIEPGEQRQDAGINIEGIVIAGKIIPFNQQFYDGDDEETPGNKINFTVKNPINNELQDFYITDIYNTSEEIVEPELKDFEIGQTPIGIKELPFIFSSGGEIASMKTRNMINILYRLNNAQYTEVVFPVLFEESDVLWFKWDYLDLQDNTGSILLKGGFNGNL